MNIDEKYKSIHSIVLSILLEEGKLNVDSLKRLMKYTETSGKSDQQEKRKKVSSINIKNEWRNITNPDSDKLIRKYESRFVNKFENLAEMDKFLQK